MQWEQPHPGAHAILPLNKQICHINIWWFYKPQTSFDVKLTLTKTLLYRFFSGDLPVVMGAIHMRDLIIWGGGGGDTLNFVLF